MFKKMCIAIAFMALGAGFQLFAVRTAGPISRSVCPPCPTNSAQFCNVCADTGVIGNLVVQNSLTLCPGVTLPIEVCFMDEIQVNAYGMTSSADSGIDFFLNGPTFVAGWPIVPSFDEPETITTQFAVPFDIDTNFDPTITLHFVIVNSSALLLSRAPDSVNFQVEVTFAGDGADLETLIPVTFDTGDLVVDSINPGTFHYQVDIPVVGATFDPGNFAYVAVTRIATTEDSEYSFDASLVELVFSYRKFAC
ncbi:MAG: hypothetical protein AMXMBFR12_02820 [Candidatus Babeliales bacterium]